MIAFVLSITKNPGESETLVNDTIVKLTHTIDPVKVPPSKIVSYLMVMLRNAAFSWFRHDKVVRSYHHFPSDLISRSALEEAISREAVSYFKSIVRGLPKAFQRVIILNILENLSYEQISKKLKIPVGTVMSRMHRARRWLLKLVDYMKAE